MDKNPVSAFLILLTVTLFCFTSLADAQVLVLKNSKKSYDLNYPSYLVDYTQNLTPAQAVKQSDFKPAKLPILSQGATNAAVWVKIRVLNQTPNTDWYLQIDSPPVLQSVEVYQMRKGSLERIFSTHAQKPKTAAHVKVNNLLIPLLIPKGVEAEYFIRAKSNNILRIPLKVISFETSIAQSHLPDVLNGITFGMLMAFSLYNLFFYLLTKELPYLYYFGYIFLWNLNLFFYNGYLSSIFPGAIWLNNAGIILASAALLSILFTNSFLKTRINSPFFYQISGFMSILTLLILFTAIFWKGANAFIMIQYLMYPFFIYWFGAGLLSLKNGYKPALYYLLGFGSLMMGNAVYNLKDLNILPDHLITRSSMHWGTLLEALILSFALANRLNFYQKQKAQIGLQIIEEKRNFLKELLQRQEQEKKRIALELHDNIGQQLILIKNKAWKLERKSEEALSGSINLSISHIGEIMTRIRGILHRLRPYQMDLLGLTESINGMIVEVFSHHELEISQIDHINHLFNPDESIHIFRIIQLITSAIPDSEESLAIRFAVLRHPGQVNFEFDIHPSPLGFEHLQDINNRLELLNGSISIDPIESGTRIKVKIPYTHPY